VIAGEVVWGDEDVVGVDSVVVVGVAPFPEQAVARKAKATSSEIPFLISP
jgi:hypothetical protein